MDLRCIIVVGVGLLVQLASTAVVNAAAIPDQPGADITCTGPAFYYSHDVHQHGIDTNLKISGEGGFIAETHINPGAAYYTDAVKNAGVPGVYTYTFTAEPGAVIADASVKSKYFILATSGIVTGSYRLNGEGSAWNPFLYAQTGSATVIDDLENIYAHTLELQYTVERYYSVSYEDHVQLFRSWGPLPNPGQPGDFAFEFSASVITDIDCHKADIHGDDLYIDLADFAVLAGDFGKSGQLAGDIDTSGTCDIADLAEMASKWLCSCYVSQ